MKEAPQRLFGIHFVHEPLQVLIVGFGRAAHVLCDLTLACRLGVENRFQDRGRVACHVVRVEQQLGKAENLGRLEHGASGGAGFVSVKQFYPHQEALAYFSFCPNSCPKLSSIRESRTAP